MIETGILNRDIVAELAKLGHTDRVLIADAGLAIPNTTKVIDISLDENIPTTIDVLKVLLKHFSVEKIIVSQATVDVSPSRYKEYLSLFDKNMPCEIVEHSTLRDTLTKEVKFAIRTGDFTANSNIILVSAGGPRWYCENVE
ncbi:MAG TPA: D-ribose pyranase [Acetivibrio sp.]|jgi:D-ribose pyranase|nr:D-ribose pyranase [Clostridium sp.]HQA58342.1 D-ribose pyranase [Acetivibrio sp.]